MVEKGKIESDLGGQGVVLQELVYKAGAVGVHADNLYLDIAIFLIYIPFIQTSIFFFYLWMLFLRVPGLQGLAGKETVVPPVSRAYLWQYI